MWITQKRIMETISPTSIGKLRNIMPDFVEILLEPTNSQRSVDYLHYWNANQQFTREKIPSH
jgi:hypothetical protein